MSRNIILGVAMVLGFAGCQQQDELEATETTGGEREGAEQQAEPPSDAEMEAGTEGGMAGEQEMPARAATVGVQSQDPYGEYLVDSEGRTLYGFTADQQGQSSSCYDDCARAWPPLLTADDPQAATAALNDQLLGTIERQDGAMQVTYNGWPLYYFDRDEQAGDITGQDVQSFGGEWYLVRPDGTMIERERQAAR